MIAKNLKFLRKHKGASQQRVSDDLGLKRSTYAGYEGGKVEPDITMLRSLSDYFEVSLDVLLRDNLEQQGIEWLRQQDPSIRNEQMRVLAITTNPEGRENIEVINESAKAGYMTGYADPEFIEEMPKLELPNLTTGTYRAFEIQGDSMLPIRSGDLVVGQYVERARDLTNNCRYVLLTRNEGIVFKRLLKQDPEAESLMLLSDNTEYQPYNIDLGEILEAWQYVLHIQKGQR
jgi:transcriptional regulator with XRE-family HTH domain